MKIFSNFDTQLDDRLFVKAKEEFWDDCVLFVRRDRIYLILRVFMPLMFWFLLMVLILLSLGSYMSGSGFFSVVLARTVRGGIVWSLLWLGRHCVVKLIDYYMDYTIVTPEWVTQYDQSGILERSTRALDITKVKTVSVKKKWLLCSVFNFWAIVFFSEGDSDHWDIKLNFITDPIKLRDSIQSIVKKGIQLDQKELADKLQDVQDSENL